VIVLPTFANEMKMEGRLDGSWNDAERVKMGLRVWLVERWWKVDAFKFLVSFVQSRNGMASWMGLPGFWEV
jgi:hypothetical protein